MGQDQQVQNHLDAQQQAKSLPAIYRWFVLAIDPDGLVERREEHDRNIQPHPTSGQQPQSVIGDVDIGYLREDPR